MASKQPKTLRWGIMATGMIASDFAKDLLVDPATRDVHDVRHEIVAVASSSSAERVASFIKQIDGPASAKAYDSYMELVKDPAVDIVYIATPHGHHFQNAMLVMHAGKHVLCEKALTVNAAQARKLVETAKAKGLFLMEAVWTRFFPLSIKIREMIASGEIGTVYRTLADFSFNYNGEKDDGTLKLADSSFGQLGPRGRRTPGPSRIKSEKPETIAAMNQYRTGADTTTALILRFPRHNSMGIATMTAYADTNSDGTHIAPVVRIQGSKGEIQVGSVAFRPTFFKVIKEGRGGKVDVVDCSIPQDSKRGNWGHGLFWEADECARCIRDGKQQSEILPWSESIAIMEAMESALKQGGIRYPNLITSDSYDEKSPLNVGNH